VIAILGDRHVLLAIRLRADQNLAFKSKRAQTGRNSAR